VDVSLVVTGPSSGLGAGLLLALSSAPVRPPTPCAVTPQARSAEPHGGRSASTSSTSSTCSTENNDSCPTTPDLRTPATVRAAGAPSSIRSGFRGSVEGPPGTLRVAAVLEGHSVPARDTAAAAGLSAVASSVVWPRLTPPRGEVDQMGVTVLLRPGWRDRGQGHLAAELARHRPAAVAVRPCRDSAAAGDDEWWLAICTQALDSAAPPVRQLPAPWVAALWPAERVRPAAGAPLPVPRPRRSLRSRLGEHAAPPGTRTRTS
jgi:hypothetical protein